LRYEPLLSACNHEVQRGRVDGQALNELFAKDAVLLKACEPVADDRPRGDLLNRNGPVWPIVRPYLWSVPIVTALAFTASLLEGLGIGLMIPLMSSLLSESATTPGGVFDRYLHGFANLFPAQFKLYAISAAILGLVLAKGIVQTVNQFFVTWVDGQVGHRIRSSLASRLLEIDYLWFMSQNPARLITIVASESWRASEAMKMYFGLVTGAVAVCVFAVLLAIVNLPLFLLVGAGVVVIRSVQHLYARYLERLSRRFTEANHWLGEQMLSVVENMRLIRVFGRKDLAQSDFDASSEQVRSVQYELLSHLACSRPILEIMQAILFITTLLVASGFGMNVAVLLTFLVLLYRMQPHVMAVNQARLGLASAKSSVSEVEWLLSQPTCEMQNQNKYDGVTGPLCFENVSFHYPSRELGEAALSDVSFSIETNSVIGLIGRSGSGKSTIINLICRLFEPSRGRITLGGVDIASMDPVSLREHIGIAGQDMELVNGTIADNIAYGLPGATTGEIERAAELADAADFIGGLPDRYQTLVGSHGLSLSGGQRQRIGLARAILRKPDILILDEATSAVDGLSERVITELLKARAHFKMAIVISHRWSTLGCCDAGVVLENGRVIESGPIGNLGFAKMMAGYGATPVFEKAPS
jgi:ATP-binding cassette, subfamily B, bacterial MsbA